MSVSFVLVLIGVILMTISAFYNPGPPRVTVSLWNLSWAFVVAGLFLFSGTTVS